MTMTKRGDIHDGTPEGDAGATKTEKTGETPGCCGRCPCGKANKQADHALTRAADGAAEQAQKTQ